MRARSLLALVALATLVACEGARVEDAGLDAAGLDAAGEDDAIATDAAVGATARFAPAATPLDFAAVPFPSSLYLDAQGRPSLGAVPSSRTDTPYFDALRALLHEHAGFSPVGALHFGIDGRLDPRSLPASRDASEPPSIDDGVVLLDVGARSPTRGELVPLRVLYDAEHGLLTARPARGRVLRPGGSYVAALTTDLLGADGSALAPSEAFRTVRSGGTEPSTVSALVALEGAGLARERVAVAVSFDVEIPGRELAAMRDVIHADAVPTVSIDRVYPGPDGSLEDYFGTPSEDRPGIDVANSPGTEGDHALVHASTALVVLGRLRATRIVTGEGTEVGTPRRDPATGTIVAGPHEDVPFVLIVPRGASLSSLPVLVVHHGFNASRVTAHVLADTAGRAGMAVLGFDAYQHGGRAEGSRDELHDLRGSPGPDGLYETSVASVSARTFGIVGPPDGMELFPAYPLAAFLQFAADVMSVVRFLREGDTAPLREADPSLAPLAFDGARIAYLGISMGSVVGASVLAAEPDVQGFVLAVPPGSIADTLCEGAEFRGLATGTLAGYLGIRGPFDEVTRSCANDPIVDLFRWAIDAVDPLALATQFYADRLDGGPGPHALWLLAGNDQLAAPPATESMLAVAGIPGRGTGDFAFAPLALAPTPTMGNLGGRTAVAHRYEPASHGMAELLTGTSSYAAPLDPPFARRETELAFDNPVVDLHARTTRFLEAVVAGAIPLVE